MKNTLFILLFYISTLCSAQTYKYIGVEDGLSNRRVYSINKDKKGYMWFVTQEGIDRYDGTFFKHYNLIAGNESINSFTEMNNLSMDRERVLWEVTKNGLIFKYNFDKDYFQLVLQLKKKDLISYTYIDDNNNIWLCTDHNQYLFNIDTQKLIPLINTNKYTINDLVQIDGSTYYIGTDKGVYKVKLINKTLFKVHQKKLESLPVQVNKLYYQKNKKKLFIGSFKKGIYVFDSSKQTLQLVPTDINDISINCIKELNENEILIATDGAGVYKMNTDNYLSSPYIVADYSKPNTMNGNTINDIYVDNEQRIWLANYPIGITVRYNRFPKYQWFKHAIGNKNSLANDQVNSIIEDKDGDLWFATNNGISIYYSKTSKWAHILNDSDNRSIKKNHVYTTLCEVSPGIIWAGGYTSDIYIINKRSLKVSLFSPSNYGENDFQPDKHINSIIKDSNGCIWLGGYYSLKCVDLKNKKIRKYPSINSVNIVLEKDTNHIWVGCSNWLILLNKKNGKIKRIEIPKKAYIYTLHQEKNGLLYIGTCDSGMLVYNSKTNSFISYNRENNTLMSDNVYTILSNQKGTLFLSTENSLVRFNISKRNFKNWTKGQGLVLKHFNPTSGTYRQNRTFVFGSSEGAIEFDETTKLPQNYSSKLVFSNFTLFYKTVSVDDSNSPLKQNIDEAKRIDLNYDQNIFSFFLASINYDYPSNILYSWNLEGFYDKWSKPTYDNVIRYTNISPGNYILRVRSISEDNLHIIDEKSIEIVIHPPFWGTIWAKLLYIVIFGLIVWDFMQHYNTYKEQKASTDKIRFFINTAHDIRTPLSLIKAPLDDLAEKEELSLEGKTKLDTAVRNTNSLYQLITNLINFEKAEIYSSRMHVNEYEIFTFLDEIIKTFQPYVDSKHIELTYESNFRFLNVWFDKEKMESIVRNLLSNAIKYTPNNGKIKVIAFSNPDYWGFEISDSGIGIPEEEQKKLFKLFVRGSNAINSKITGSGIGLLMVRKLVQLHKGTISLKSKINSGSSFRVSFPQGHKHFKKHHLEWNHESISDSDTLFTSFKTKAGEVLPPSIPLNSMDSPSQRILIVEDNDDMRNYLQHTLADIYYTFVASDGKIGWDIVQNIKPDLVISDIMMPNMNGDELCSRIKSDINTSHIPVILLTALNDKSNIIRGLKYGADEYITKPFDISILKATIINILSNRAVLKNSFSKLELKNTDESINYASELDREFMNKVKDIIEKNLSDSNFNVDVLCSALNMSRSSFYSKIKALTDQAPADFIRSIRLARAAKLLRSKRLNITEVADMTGFSDAKYFREVFKKHYKMNPSKYMNEDQV
ncbi:Two component regulator propeller [Bacteroides luti]|uniref:histidine kinase n=1 Tax=Bacteroides luti TaxID=1297750 RepID=A0A1M5FB96_9BACE|nr:two-component regulator propeller domain-containing protein [Bacteroides luti]SHF88678.1 Two component regulator propeller [Bacteroides luti]